MILLILMTGIIAGLLSGLLGIGGGVIIVPVLIYCYQAHALFPPDQIMHFAVGTSLAAMILTTAGSLFSHVKHNHYTEIALPFFWWLMPGLWIGAWSGNFLNSLASLEVLKIVLILIIMIMAFRLLCSPHLFFRSATEAESAKSSSRSFSSPVFLSIGIGVGTMSSLVGIGGGLFLWPILAYMRLRPIEVSAATSIGTFGSVCMGTIGSIYFGWGMMSDNEWVTGYVYWPWALLIGITGMMCAPIGVWLSRRLPVSAIKKLFALILVLIAARIGFNL